MLLLSQLQHVLTNRLIVAAGRSLVNALKNPGYMLTSCCVWCNHVKSTYSKTKYNFLILAKTIAGRDNAAKFFVSLKQNNSEGFIGAP